MLNSSENFFNCKEICYKSVKFHHYSSLWNSKSVRYIRKFVKTLKFCKDNLKNFPGTQKNFAISDMSLYPCSYYTSFTAHV